MLCFRSEPSTVGYQHVAHAPDRLDQFGVIRPVADRLAQPRDLKIHCAIRDHGVAAQCAIDQLGSAERASAAAHQGCKQSELPTGKLQRCAFTFHCSRREIDLERSDRDDVVRERAAVPPRPAQHGGEAGHQFARLKGFGQVIVGAGFQSDDAVDRVAPGRQHHDGCHVARCPKTPANGQPVLTGHHQIQHDGVCWLSRQLPVQCRTAVYCAGLKTVLAQKPAQQRAKFAVVINNDHFV